MDKLEGLLKADVIRRVVARLIADRAWRSVAEKEACAYLQKNEKKRRPDVVAYVLSEYEAAGAGFSGRWQGTPAK